MRRALMLSILCAAAVSGAVAHAQVTAGDIRMRGAFIPLRAPVADARPPVGEVRASVQADGDVRIDLVVSGLEGQASTATLHTGRAGENGEQVARMDVSVDGADGRVIGGTARLTPLVAQRVRAGEAYVVVRTSEYPDGILRAQLAPQARSLESVVVGD